MSDVLLPVRVVTWLGTITLSTTGAALPTPGWFILRLREDCVLASVSSWILASGEADTRSATVALAAANATLPWQPPPATPVEVASPRPRGDHGEGLPVMQAHGDLLRVGDRQPPRPWAPHPSGRTGRRGALVTISATP